MDMMGGFGGWGFGLGGIGMIVWWGLIIAGIVFLVRWLADAGGRRAPGGKTALDILEERYARGELDRDAFEAMRRDLNG